MGKTFKTENLLAVFSGILLLACPSVGNATIHNISVGNFFFTPLKTSVLPGDTVRWNFTGGSHTTTTEVTSPKQWDSGLLTSGSFSVVFPASSGPGPFPYLCTTHALDMIDTIFTTAVDTDADTKQDWVDNCPTVANPGQQDTDGDLIGDACDACPTQPNPCSCCNLAGDVDDGGDVNIGDVTFLIGYIFQGGQSPSCASEADADGGGDVNIGDATYIIAFIFQGGPAPGCGP